MRFKYYFNIAFRNLFRRKVRNFFSLFSLVIAGLLLAVLGALVLGVSEFVKSQTSFLGMPENVIMVYHKFGEGLVSAPEESSDQPREVKEEQKKQNMDFEPPQFKQEDIDKISKIEGVKEIEYNFYLGSSPKAVQLKGQDKKFEISPEYNSLVVGERGRILSGRKLETSDKGVAVISSTFLKVFKLTNPEELLGKQITLLSDTDKSYKFNIVGVLDKSVARTPELLVGFDDAVQIERDDTGNAKLYVSEFSSSLYVIVNDKNNVDQISAKIDNLGFDSSTNEEMIRDINNTIRWVFLILTGIAFTISSLFVFSTMSVAVKDRTKEIGIMKAVGASKGVVRTLFTFEASLLGLIAGIISSAVSFGIITWFNIYAHNTFLSEFPTFNILNYTWYLPLAVITTTVFFSIVAAFWPSFRASRIDPINAIRSE